MSAWEHRPVPFGWLRSKWCARFHRRHVSMGYDDGGTNGQPVATALCRKCGRMVVLYPATATEGDET